MKTSGLSWLLALSAVAAIAFDVLEGVLHLKFVGPELWLPPAKYALYAAFGFFVVRWGVDFPRAVVVVACTAIADVAIGWWVADNLVFGRVSLENAQPLATPTSDSRFTYIPLQLNVVYAPADIDAPGERMALAVIRYSAVGGVAAALATARRKAPRCA